MKNKKLMVTSKTFIIISVLSTILIVIATYSMLNKDSIDFSNLKVEKRISYTTSDKEEIKLNEIAKTKLINLLKKQSLSETDNPVNCIIIGMYQISFDNYIIWFDKEGCTAYLTNKKHNDNYQIDLLDDIKGLIMNLDK